MWKLQCELMNFIEDLAKFGYKKDNEVEKKFLNSALNLATLLNPIV